MRSGTIGDGIGGGKCLPRFVRDPVRVVGRCRAALVVALAVIPALAAAEGPALPYGYERLNEPAAEASVALANEAGAGVRPEVLALVNPDNGARAVRLETLRFGDGSRVVVGWQDLVREPILRPAIDPAEERDLVRALNDNLPAGALVFALPERSRRLARLTPLDLPLSAAPLAETLRIPGMWAGSAEAIARAEASADGQLVTPEGAQLWDLLRAALVAPFDDGRARLTALAGGRPAYLVLHVSDAFHLGIGTGERLVMVVRDLPTADVHGAAQQVKRWQRDGNYPAYAVQSLGLRGLRAYFLTSRADRELLATRLLPFLPVENEVAPEGFRLVWQGGGYWVWEFTPHANGNKGRTPGGLAAGVTGASD